MNRDSPPLIPGGIDRVLLILRWLALVLAVGLSFIDRSTEGVFVGVFPLAGGIAIYNLAVLFLPRFLRWLRQPFNVLALDGLVATLAVYLNGGYHSAFFILYVFVLIAAAFRLSVMSSLLLANLAAFLYVAACLLNPARLSALQATYLVGTKLTLLLIVALLSSLLLEQLRREQEETARERALAEAQTTFVSAVSHELRTPLTCIKTSVELLQAAESLSTDEICDELVQTISDHTGRLESLVNDLLQVTRLEAGQVVLTRQPTDTAQFLRRVAESFEPLLVSRRQTLDLDLPDGLPRVWVDRARIEQVTGNLLSNAIKFTPRGGHIRLALRKDGDSLAASVSDDGPGISDEEQTLIFNKFHVGRDQRATAGVGLGLYIARRLVELHDGNITVQSVPGQGATFTFTIPIKTDVTEA
ncbi:MAG: ATP-binding protein [Chloroflexota bacterium]|nr:ATP-binding protein [Chloroflexota bacterium]